MTASVSEPSCGEVPPWVAAYARFHSIQRLNASAPTLVYTAASDPMRCTYLGDRVRGITFALRMAAATGRVLYIHYPEPCAWAAHLQPTCIDWRVRASVASQCNATGTDRYFWMPPKREADVARHAAFISTLIRDEFSPPRRPCVAFIGNMRWPTAFAGQYAASNASLSDLWPALFEPTAALRKAIADAKRTILGPNGATDPYVAMHLRLGDAAEGTSILTRKWFTKDRRLSHSDAVHMIACALRSTRLPILIATDNAWLRSALLASNVSAVLRHAAYSALHRRRWIVDELNDLQLSRVRVWPGFPSEGHGATKVSAAFDAATDWMVSIERSRCPKGSPCNPNLALQRTPPPRSERDALRTQAAELRMLSAFVEMGLIAGARCLVPSPPSDYVPMPAMAKGRRSKLRPRLSVAHGVSQFSDTAAAWGRLELCEPAPELQDVCWWPPAAEGSWKMRPQRRRVDER